MPLEFQPLEIPYGQLDTHTDPTAMEPGTLTKAENVSSQVDGRYGKRFGYDSFATTSSTTGVRLGKRGNELMFFDGANLKSYRQPIAFWRDLGVVPEPSVSERPVLLDQANDVTSGSRVTYGGVTVHAYIDSSGFLQTKVVDASDGSLLTTRTDASNAYQIVHTALVGATIVVVYSSVASQVIRYLTVNPATIGGIGPFTIYSGADVYAGSVPYPYAPFDICSISSTDILIVHCTDTPEIKLSRMIVSSGALTAGATISTEVPDGGMAIKAVPGENGVIAFHSASAGAMRVRGFDPALLTTSFALTTLEADPATGTNWNCGLIRVDALTTLCVWDRRDAAPLKGYTAWATISYVGGIGTIIQLPNFHLQTKPFAYGDRQYVTVYAPYETQETYITIQINRTAPRWQPVATHAFRRAFTVGPGMTCLTEMDAVSAEVYWFDSPIGYKFLSNSSLRAGMTTFGMDFTDPKRFQNCEIGGSMVVAGGTPFQYDGNTWAENNFIIYPEITAATPGSVLGSGMDNGTYSYIVVFERSDANGNVSRSTTSLPFSATTSAGAGLGAVSLTIDYYLMTAFVANASTAIAAVFRTEAGGETYYFVGSQKMNALGASFTYVDSANDSTILSNRIIYTQGGILDREPPPPYTQMVVHNNRLWGFSSVERKMVFYSGDYVPGESPWFSTAQQFRIDPGGDITALASLDEKLIIFKRDRIFKVTGRGGNASGSSSDLTPPDVITSDCGCIDHRSVVVIPQGILFQSDKGIYMLTRGEELTFVGLPVDYYVNNFPTINAATLMPTVMEVRFHAENSLDEGLVLVYNYRDNRWTTHTNYDYGDGTERVDALVVNNSYYTVDAQANVSIETPDEYRDPGSTYVVSELETGWIKPAGKQGLVRCQRILFLNELVEDHDMEFEIDKDYVNTSVQSAVYTAADMATLPQEQVAMHVQDQQGESWRVRMRDAESGAGDSEGFRARGVTLLVGVKRGTVEKIMQAGAKA
jgi:hypothetical protein